MFLSKIKELVEREKQIWENDPFTKKQIKDENKIILKDLDNILKRIKKLEKKMPFIL